MSLVEQVLLMVDSTQVAPVTAFLLGLVTSISPCPLASNIAAIAYISRNMTRPRDTFVAASLYTLGRVFTYSILGVLLVTIGLKASEVALPLQSWGNSLMGPILILGGLVLADLLPLGLPSGSTFMERLRLKAGESGTLGSFLLGALLALAFCPYSAVFFFALLIPLSLKTTGGVLLPPIFGVGTALPVAVFALILSLGYSSVERIVKQVTSVEIVLRKITAFIFIVVGLYYLHSSVA